MRVLLLALAALILVLSVAIFLAHAAGTGPAAP